MNEFDRPRHPDHLPPITTARELHERWETLLGTGYGRRVLYCGFLAGTGRMAPMISCVEDVPDRPDRRTTENLLHACRRVLDEFELAGGSVAILIGRPGPSRIDPDDLAWARTLLAAARATGVPLQPIHLGTDSDIRVFAADDLLEPQSARS